MKKCDVKKYFIESNWLVNGYLKDRRKKIKIKNENCCKNKKYDTDNTSN